MDNNKEPVVNITVNITGVQETTWTTTKSPADLWKRNAGRR